MKIRNCLSAAALTLSGLLWLPSFGASNPSALKLTRKVNVPEPTTIVAGIMVYNQEWSNTSPESGVYYIEVKPGGAITPQYKSAAMADVVCALKKDNVMYAAEATTDFRYYYRQMNVSDWSTIGSRQEIDMEDVPAGLTYDAKLGKAYGSFWSDNYGGFSYFGSFNLASASWTSIDKVQRDERDIFALAADGKGTIYALFGAFNYLATLDPTTGQVDRIKTTGFEIDTNWAEGRVSSMCYDAENDRLIATIAETLGWGANKSYRSGLYTINPHTGVTTKVMDLPGNACFAGLYVVDDSDNPLAPGEPTDLRVNLNGTAAVGTVSFTMPSKTMGGLDMSGTYTAIINLNGTETYIFDLNPGQTVTSPELTFLNGTNNVRVTIADEERRGGSQSLEFFAGVDTPKAATDVALNVEDGKAVLTWTAPTEGANGGMIDPAGLKYRITRMPEGKTVAEAVTGTSFTDSNLDPTVKIIYYTVQAYNEAGEAEAVESNRCPTAGTFPVPFAEHFDTTDDFGLWTVENTNGGSTWEYNANEQAVDYEYDSEKKPADDWLISPPVKLEAGKTYRLSYKWKVMMKAYPESFEILLGSSSKSEAMDRLLASHLKVSNTAFQEADLAFTVDNDGAYYLGVHCISDSYMYILRIDDITIDELDNRVPATVSDLTVTPYAEGQRGATVSFTVPDKDNKGDALEEVTSVTIVRNNTTLATLTDVTPGQKVNYEDKAVGADGIMKYSVVCENENGAGVAAVVETFVGTDAPGAVTDLTVTEEGSHPHLSWTAPTTGVNGGWFDASAVVYRIVRSDGEVVAQNCAETAFTDESYTSPSKGQDAIWYLVTPYVGTTKGAYAQSDLILLGTPYPTPASESFAGADMAFYPWIAQSDNAINYAWTLDNMGYNPQTSDQNGDRGLATFHSVGEPEGTVSYFYSPKFDIAGLDNPTLSFYLYHAEGEGDGSIELLVSAGTSYFSPLEGAEKILRTSAQGWTRYAVSLKEYKSAPWVRIGFKGTGDAIADIYLDNVSIDSQLDTDLALTALSLPSKIAAGENVRGKATVLNAGTSAVEGATLTITGAEGTVLATTDVPTLEAGSDATVEFAVTATTTGTLSLTATIAAEGDSDASNNTLSASLKVVAPAVNAPFNLEGSIDDGILTLSWQAPTSRGAVTDDVEDYEDFAIDGIGDWTMWDGDYDITYMISNGYDYPHATDRKAFQVCNASLLGIDIWDEGKPHSGDKMFMALASYIYVNNDWLISPELNGKEQWVSFYARSFTLQNTPAERMRIWYSTTDNDPANFTEITSSFVELPGTWQKYSYFLPEGTKYFAINCVSDGAFAMFVDDLCFNDLTVPTWDLHHYEIYRNGEKIGETAEPSFSTSIDNTKGEFTVKAIFDRGESPLSEGLTLTPTGISTSVDDGDVRYYDVNGFEVKNPQPGSVLIRIQGSEATKVIVK